MTFRPGGSARRLVERPRSQRRPALERPALLGSRMRARRRLDPHRCVGGTPSELSPHAPRGLYDQVELAALVLYGYGVSDD